MDLEALQARLADERFEDEPFPGGHWGIKEKTELTKGSGKRCQECGAKVRRTIEGVLLCKHCYWRPCVYRCGNLVGPKRSICDSCAADAEVNPHSPSMTRKT